MIVVVVGALLLAAWSGIAIVVGLWLGRVIGLRDRQIPRMGGTVATAGLAICLAVTGCSDTTAAVAVSLPVQVPAYEREAFGDGWADLDHDGCDTRQEVLARDLVDERLDRDGCKVLTGTLDDPYTGFTIQFRRGQTTSDDVQIDHMIPLAYAWRAGAWAWTDAQRERFANDPGVLLAVDGPTNNRKSDRGPARWLPPNKAIHCDYAAAWKRILADYRLTPAPEDVAALDRIGAACRPS